MGGILGLAMDQEQAEREFLFTDRDFQFIASLMHDHMGISLPAQKKDMVYARLARRLRKLKLGSFAEYFLLVEQEDSPELENLVNAITTNVTSFFREPHHFEHLAQRVIPQIISSNAQTRRFRLWSAGCSAGMEAYSMAMTLAATIPDLRGWDIKILATDIDTNVIERGKKAEYDEDQLPKIPESYHSKYIEHDAAKGVIRVREPIRELVHFKQLNLHDAWPMKGPFDVVFCRNVVIYFDKPTQRILFDRFADIIRADGWLYIGHSESLNHVTERFELQGNTIYRKVA